MFLVAGDECPPMRMACGDFPNFHDHRGSLRRDIDYADSDNAEPSTADVSTLELEIAE